MSARAGKISLLVVCSAFVLSTLCCQAEEQPTSKAPQSIAKGNAAGLSDDWKQEADIPDLKDSDGTILLHGAKLKLWVEQGWLVIRRETERGNLEWQIVLARAVDPQPPTIDVLPTKCEIRYGSYFVRDFLGSLRVLRERKTNDLPPWPSVPVDKDAKQLVWGGAKAGFDVAGWQIGDWCWLACGMSDNRNDIWVRVQHKDLRDGGYGVQTTFGIGYFQFGECRFQDEGDLFVGRRATADEEEVAAALRHKKIRAELIGQAAPDLTVKQWFNAPTDSSLKHFQGKVVLLEFWATWCGSCVENLPKVAALEEKFKDRGLVVVGMHSAQGDDTVETFLKDKDLKMPVAVDTGQTAKDYALDAVPTYFLLDKQGRVKWGFSNSPPTEKQIENALQ